MQNMIWSGRIVFTLLIIILFNSCTQDSIIHPSIANYKLIPKAQRLDTFPGYFLFNNAQVFYTNKELTPLVEDFIMFSQKRLDVQLNIAGEKITKNNIILTFIDNPELGDEGYQLSVENETLNLVANSLKGFAHGLSSIKQLAMLNSAGGNIFIPNLQIKDWPAFEHRGLLLDCARHFFTKDVIKKYIDLLSLYKMNVFHWHLTEDQAWRIAIEKYPKLTEVGAWRTELDGSSYGGFYSKKDIEEIVAYAERKQITIIPEIELPGHSQAAIAAYRHLSCTGKQIEVANDWGVFKDIYCAGNDSVYIFLEDVLSEVIALFPSKYIHIGGDEAPKIRWEQCSRCQQRIEDEHLKDEHDLQSYFIKRIQTFLNANDRQLIGWDEILEGGLAEGAIVQSWRGMQGGIEAIRHGNRAIMSPTSHAYLDYGLKAIDLQKVYSFYPVPKELNKEESKKILGGECNMWTEHVPNEHSLDSKVFPRMLAMSEVLWSDSSGRNYAEFKNRVYSHYSILDQLNVNYGNETTPFQYMINTSANMIEVAIEKKISDIDITHQLNGEKTIHSYQSILKFDRLEESTIIAVANRNNKQIGDSLSLKIHPHLALTKNIEYISDPYSEWYTAGGIGGLTDGVLGSLDFRDGHWQGFWGNDLECILDLDEIRSDISIIEANFYQYNNSWIFLPSDMSVEVSTNGNDWNEWGKAKNNIDPRQRGHFIYTMRIEHPEESFRYLKIKVKNIMKVPEWHEAAGSDAWIFIDEIIVK